MLGGIMLAITVPPESGAESIVRVVLLMVLIVAVLFAKRDNRRKGLGAAQPIMQHGPPGWDWDPDTATWRKPR